MQIGDARELTFADGSADAVLLLGPLYHLVKREDRLRALGEAGRVLKAGGVAIVAGISRFASTADGVVAGMLSDPRFASIVAEDVATGVHLNPTAHPGWFATAYFHRPDELAREVALAGLVPDGPVAVEGLGWLAPDVDALLDDINLRGRVLEAIRRVEREPALLGASAHFLVAGRSPSHISP